MVKCKDCKFWHFQEKEDIKFPDLPTITIFNGECRRKSPAFMAGQFTDELEWAQGVWPDTTGDDWCGEFKPRENKDETCPRCKGDGHWHSIMGFHKEITIVKCPECKGS